MATAQIRRSGFCGVRTKARAHSMRGPVCDLTGSQLAKATSWGLVSTADGSLDFRKRLARLTPLCPLWWCLRARNQLQAELPEMDLEPFDTLAFRLKARTAAAGERARPCTAPAVRCCGTRRLPLSVLPLSALAKGWRRLRPGPVSACGALQGDGRKYIASLRTDAWVDMPVRRSPAPTRALVSAWSAGLCPLTVVGQSA